jgi:hypothetical protein
MPRSAASRPPAQAPFGRLLPALALVVLVAAAYVPARAAGAP